MTQTPFKGKQSRQNLEVYLQTTLMLLIFVNLTLGMW